MNFCDYSALELAKKIKCGEIKVTDVVTHFIQKAEQDDCNAFITINKESALFRAKEVQRGIDEGRYTSPLAGIPIAIKDNICTKDIPTTCASKMLSDFTPVYNATVIDRLENAGLIVLTKLNMDEFAMGSTGETSFFGAVKNPWDKNKVSGGSSSGAAAAVSSGAALIALGSDTGGSIRQPASYCGVTGFKPTYGTVSRFGLIAYASSLDQIGPIAKNADDCAAITNIIRGIDEKDSTSLETDFVSSDLEVQNLRIAVVSEGFQTGVENAVSDSLLSAVDLLRSIGASVEYIDFPSMKYFIPSYYIIASAEASSNLSRYDGVKYGFRSNEYSTLSDMYADSRSKGFGNEVKKRIMLGTFVLSSGYYDAYYKKALQSKSLITKEFDKVFENFDVIICPTVPNTAPKLGESLSDSLSMYLSDIFTVGANLAGLPAISVPCGFDGDDMPIGMQIIGNRLCDSTVLSVASKFQQISDHHKRRAEVGR